MKATKRRTGICILGSTGMVGQRFIELLQNHPWFEIKLLAASASSKGKTYEEAVQGRWKMDTPIPENIKSKVLLDAENDCEEICSSVDFVFSAMNMETSKLRDLEYAYAKHECPVVSNNSAHRWTKDVPVIIPEINPKHIEIINAQKQRLQTKNGFIATKPNCSLQSFLPVVFPLMKFGVKSIIVSTYQAISGAGKVFKDFPEIEDNVIPFIDGEETKTENEPLKILGTVEKNEIIPSAEPSIISSCVRVPVSNGHLASVFVEFKNKVSVNEIIDIWNNFNPVKLPSSPEILIKYFSENDRPQPKLDRMRENGMGFNVGRLRQYADNKIKFVCMSHNTIRGAAGGAILLAELLYKEGYLKSKK